MGQLIWFSSTTIIPISLTIAVWLYRLYDIDIIINRTLVYGVLTVGTMGIYVAIVGLLGILFQGQSGSFPAFLTTGLVAVLFALGLLAVKTGVFASKGEARRMLSGGGVSISKQKVSDPEYRISESDVINGKYIVIQKGKKNYYLLRVKH